MKRMLKRILVVLLVLILLAVAGFGMLYAGRLRTVNSIEQITAYDDYNLYRMDVTYDYSIDDVINYGITDNQSMIDAILKETLPLLPVHMKAPNYGCSAFATVSDGNILMGRNYDFKRDTSAMLVYCTPKDGYKSVALAALDNISANQPDISMAKKLACLTAPFICLDGMNEKGVSIAVLTLDSEPVNQDTGKQKIFTTLAIRLVLDRAATTQEAVELLDSYDMFATSGRDYHFFVTDAGGDSALSSMTRSRRAARCAGHPCRPSRIFTAAMPTWCSQTRETASTATEKSAMTLLWKCWQCAIPTGIFLRIPHGRRCRQPPRTPAPTT